MPLQLRRVNGAVLALLVFAGTGSLAAQKFPDAALVRGTLSFDAKATLGDFTGTTTTLTGEMNGAETLNGVRGWVEAPANSLSSKNGKRDRDTWKSLEVEKYPTIRFQLDSVSPGAPQGDSTAVTLVGHFSLHGQTRAARIAGWLWRRSTEVHFKGALPMNVKDYGVGGLTKALGMLRMNEKIVVRVDVTFGR